MRGSRWVEGAARTLAPLVAMLALMPRPGQAQIPLEIWLRPLAAVPVGGFASRDDGISATASVGFDAGGAVALGPLSIYGEYQEISFGCAECEEVDLDGSTLDRGWGAGVLIPLRRPFAGFEPWARIGVIGHHLRFRYGDESAYSSAALGWSVGVGAETRPLRWLRIEPSLLLRGYEAGFGFAIDVPDRDVSVTYIALGLGIGIGL